MAGDDANDAPADNAGDVAAAIGAVAVKIPEFFDWNVALWFAQIDASFDSAKVVHSRTRFDHVVSKLKPAIAARVASHIQNPDANDPYGVLKEALIKACAPTDQQRVQRVLGAALGDKVPTALLQELITLWPDPDPEESRVFKAIFIGKMPAALQPTLAAMRGGDVTGLAECADVMVAQWRAAQPAAVAQVSGAGFYDDPAQAFAVAARSSTAFRGGRGGQSRPRPKPSGTRQASGAYLQADGRLLCVYHATYGAQARRCAAPCAESRALATNANAAPLNFQGSA